MKKLTANLTDPLQLENALNVFDYISDSKEEISTKINGAVTKVNKNITKNKTVKVKYFCEYLPEDKKDPLYENASEMIPKYADGEKVCMDVTAYSVEYDEEYDRYLYHTGIYMDCENSDGCLIVPNKDISKTDSYLCNFVWTNKDNGELILIFKNRESINQMIRNMLIYRWLNEPWYKKIFKNYRKWVSENTTPIKKIALKNVAYYGPYGVGDKIAQLIWFKSPDVKLTQVKYLDKINS